MKETIEYIQVIIAYVCFAALGMMFAGVFLAKAFAPAWEQIRRFMSLGRIQQIVLGVCIIGFIQYGATKSSFRWDGGIKDNGSYATNSTLHVAWQRDTSQGVLVPLDATVYIDYRTAGSTGEVWNTLAESVVRNWQWNGIVQDATNFDYSVWAYYIPPEPVHTNGVWLYKTMKDRNGKYAIPLRARIEINSKAIATPCEKRKDEENE